MAKPKNTRFPFTAIKVRNLTAGTSAYDCRDAGCPGLVLRVAPTGRKTWRWSYHDAMKKHRAVTLGVYPDMGLSAARHALDTAREHHRQNLEQGTVETHEVGTVGELAELFYQGRILKTRKRPEEARRIIDTDIIPGLGRLKLSPPPRTPVVGKMIMAVVNRGATVHAGKVLDLTRQMFDFGVSLGHLTVNPAAPLRGVDLGVEGYVPRSRVLDADEIRALWTALDNTSRASIQSALGLKLLLLTGVRSQELLRAEWKHVDLKKGTWTIPITDQKMSLRQAKQARPFTIPLAPQAVALFERLKYLADVMGSPWVMASRSRSGHFDSKALGHFTRRLLASGALEIPPFSPHDLRRTMRTQLGEVLGIEPHVAERCLNHSMGKLTATYDTGHYLEQREAAMRRWGDQVDLYVTRPDNMSLLTREAS